MKDMNSLKRKCSAALAAGAGVAVCLTGGGPVQAVFISGSIAGTNAGVTVFAPADSVFAFGSLARWYLNNAGGGRISFSWFSDPGVLNGTGVGSYAAAHGAGITVSAGMPNGFHNLCWVPSSLSDKYFAVQFLSGTRYGWLHVVSSNAAGGSITIDKWGYENTGGTCKTLLDSVATQTLRLSDGRVQLHWTNANEDGVARYEVQAKDASGAWQALGSEAPGDGHYAAVAAANSECRLIVEKVDGTTADIGF